MMKKYLLDLIVKRKSFPQPKYVLLQLTDPHNPLPDMLPGQFVEIRVEATNVFLRCPISINWVDRQNNELWLLVHVVGDATRALSLISEGSTLNVMLPLGKGFTLPEGGTEMLTCEKPLLVGGGVGVAPLLYLGGELCRCGVQPTFILGAKSANDMLQLHEFQRLGNVYITTEDGSLGEQGFVTQHSIWHQQQFTRVYTCGPKPMMKAVATLSKQLNYPCEASLENMMACGLGACLCCVEDTREGHLCVCKEGPVFDIARLKW